VKELFTCGTIYKWLFFRNRYLLSKGEKSVNRVNRSWESGDAEQSAVQQKYVPHYREPVGPIEARLHAGVCSKNHICKDPIQ
jgi:hypothetical protein